MDPQRTNGLDNPVPAKQAAIILAGLAYTVTAIFVFSRLTLWDLVMLTLVAIAFVIALAGAYEML